METPRGRRIETMVLVSPATPHLRRTLTSNSTNGNCFQTPISSRTKTRKVSRTPSKLGEETDPFDSLLESFVLSEHDRRNSSRDDSKYMAEGAEKKLLLPSTMQQNIVIRLEELLSDDESDGLRKGECTFMFCFVACCGQNSGSTYF